MSDPQAESQQQQLSRSLGTLWEQHAGGRPKSVTAEIAGNRVRCEIDTETDAPSSPGYRNDEIAAVTRVTGRRVTGFIPGRERKTDRSTETFLLEQRHIKR